MLVIPITKKLIKKCENEYDLSRKVVEDYWTRYYEEKKKNLKLKIENE